MRVAKPNPGLLYALAGVAAAAVITVVGYQNKDAIINTVNQFNQKYNRPPIVQSYDMPLPSPLEDAVQTLEPTYTPTRVPTATDKPAIQTVAPTPAPVQYRVFLDGKVDDAVTAENGAYLEIGWPQGLHKIYIASDDISLLSGMYIQGSKGGQQPASQTGIEGLADGLYVNEYTINPFSLDNDGKASNLELRDANGNIVAYLQFEYIAGTKATVKGGGDPSDSSDPSDPSDPSCFLAGTKILMANGRRKNIENVKVGDKVRSFDEKKKKLVNSKVKKVKIHNSENYYEVRLSNGRTMKVTPNHPIYVKKKGWSAIDPKRALKEHKVKSSQLKKGDTLFGFDDSLIKIKNILFKDKKTKTFNLTDIEDTHTFFADDVLVHNKGGEDPGGNGG